jgi:hypothetical protein
LHIEPFEQLMVHPHEPFVGALLPSSLALRATINSHHVGGEVEIVGEPVCVSLVVPQ